MTECIHCKSKFYSRGSEYCDTCELKAQPEKVDLVNAGFLIEYLETLTPEQIIELYEEETLT